MRKNKMLRMASALLILVLLTTSVVGGTFAKYVTTAEETDTARVAKWGVTFTAGSDLFAESYKDPTDTNVTVEVSATGTNLVAPGTTGTGFSITNSTTTAPEVSYNVTIKLDSDTAKVPTLEYTPKSGSATTYDPVKFSVYNGNTKLGDKTFTELKELFDGTKVIYKYDVSNKKYYVDSDLDGAPDTTAANAAPDIKIKWEWAFEDGTNKALCDALDTILGDRAANSSATFSNLPDTIGTVNSSNTEVVLNWTMTATQID